jgi:protein-tyrosine phosphatase
MSRTRTSLSHPLRIDSVSIPGGEGLIGMTICPGKKGDSVYGPPWDRDLRLDLAAVKSWGADVVVTLMESRELAALGVPELGAEVEKAGMRWLHLPIRDLEAPGERFLRLWELSGPGLHNILLHGGRVLLHCRGGLGRTGTIAAQLLVEAGSRPEDAVREVRQARPGAIETVAQEHYLRRLNAGQA